MAQTDSLQLYKKGYFASKKLNIEYKHKLELTSEALQQLQIQSTEFSEIIKTHEYITYNDSLQLNMQSHQIRLLNDNVNIYRKEFSRRDKFWNKPLFGSILGVIGTVAIIHVIDYSLPR